MPLPDGIRTAIVTLGDPTGVLGTAALVSAKVTIDQTVIWAETGLPIYPFGERVDGGSFEFPLVDQPGFVDEHGATVTGFRGIVTAQLQFSPRDVRTVVKSFQVVEGDTVVNLWLVPDGVLRPENAVAARSYADQARGFRDEAREARDEAGERVDEATAAVVEQVEHLRDGTEERISDATAAAVDAAEGLATAAGLSATAAATSAQTAGGHAHAADVARLGAVAAQEAAAAAQAEVLLQVQAATVQAEAAAGSATAADEDRQAAETARQGAETARGEAVQAAGQAAATLAAAIPKSVVNAKGDIVAATANNTPGRLAIGAQGRQLFVDLNAATGLRWGEAGEGSVAPVISTGTDLNTLTRPGVYLNSAANSVNAGSNSPIGVAGWLTVSATSNTYVLQWYTSLTTNTPRVFFRNTSTGGATWNAWTELRTNAPFAGNTIHGTGSPDGTVAAPLGTIFVNTEAGGYNGARQWVKDSGTGTTGWRLTVGDTGWRRLIHQQTGGQFTLAAGWTLGVGGFVEIRRDTTQVYLRIIGSLRYDGTAGTGRLVLNETLPVGFGSYYVFGLARAAAVGSGAGAAAIGPELGTGTNPQRLMADTPGVPTVFNYGVATWPAVATWPTTLPGTPV